MPEQLPTARVRALLPRDWLGSAGSSFRQFFSTIGDFLHARERATAAPDLAWNALEGAATEKHSNAVLNYAKRENEAIETEFRRRTLESKTRQEEANANKLESEARISQTREMQARVELFEKLKSSNLLPVWDNAGRMTIIEAPADLDWDGLRIQLISDAAKSMTSGE